jgi:hypothetical protein
MGHKKEFNKYKIVGNEVIIYLDKRNGDVIESIIDLKYLNKLIELDWHWSPSWYNETYGYYATHSKYLGKINGKFRSVVYLMHRVILGASPDEVIDHVDHNGLNNKELNLRKTDDLNNTKHRGRINKNNISGYRNVSWNKDLEKWVVQIQIDGKNHMFDEKFDDKEEANLFAIAMREKYYGEYSGE